MKNKSQLLILLAGLALICSMLFPIAASTVVPPEITLAWDANTEEDLAGYGIYFKTSPDQPYQLLDDVYLNELEDPDNPRVTLTELEDGLTYYFAVTAFSEEGDESRFSKKVCVQVDGAGTTGCDSEDSDDSSSGGGSGCFFAASSG